MRTTHFYFRPGLTACAVGATRKGLNVSSSENLAATLKTLKAHAEVVIYSVTFTSLLEAADLAYLAVLHDEPELYMLPTRT